MMLNTLLFLALTLSTAQAPGDGAPQNSAPVPLTQQLQNFDHLRASSETTQEAVLQLHSMGRLGTKDAVDALLHLLPHLQGELALAAVHAIALNGTSYAHDQMRLLARNRTHPDYRRQASLDLANGTLEDLTYLRDKRLKKEGDLQIRGEILRNLIDHGVDKLDKTVLKAAKSKDKVYAGVGVYGIGVLKLERGLRTVEDYLTSPDLQLRLASFRTLATFGGAASFRTLLHAYAHANNLALRPDIQLLLQSASSAEEVNILIREGLRYEDSAVVLAAASALSLAASEQPKLCAPALLHLLNHANARVRDYAIEGLVRAHPDAIVEVLIAQLAHEDPLTRTTAAWALAQLGKLPPSLAPQLILLARDSRAAIRLHVAEALQSFTDSDAAFAATIDLLQDSQWSVRAAAIQSLVAFRRTKSLEPLVQRVEQELGRVRQDAVEALSQLSGEDFGPALGTWRLWFDDLPEDYVLPPVEVAAEKLSQRRQRRAQGHDSVATSLYHGIPVPQGGVVFVLDISGSMTAPFDATESYYEHFSKALGETLAMLGKNVQFNIILFSGGVQAWKEFLVPGSQENALAAQKFLDHVRPDGPTNLYGALMSALSFAEVQTIFLLTDGDPTFGRVVMPKAILAELERVNRDRHVVINTIAAGEVRADFLADLARDNGGQAVDLTDTKGSIKNPQ